MKNTLKFLSLIILISFTRCTGNQEAGSKPFKADVIIYGGTSAAVSAAVQVVRMGQSVIIVSPATHLGGMTSSGLGFTDTGNKSVIGGIAREFYQRIYNYYQKPETWKWQKKEEYGNVGQGTPAIDGNNRTQWIFEPHIAEQVFEDFIKENKIKVYRNEWLNRENGVEMEDGKIISISTLGDKTFTGKYFIDATYEGDLMAAAGVSYTTGREANSVYGETFNGVQKSLEHNGHNFGSLDVSPYKVPGDSLSGLVPRVSDRDPGTDGEGDDRIQAYCFRLCLTKVESNRVPITRPEGYDSTQYELLARVYQAGWRSKFRKFDPIPNLKTDVNNYGPFSTDDIGMNYSYPDASYARRQEIIKEHETYEKGLLYFTETDPRVPEDVRNEMSQWGYSKDEFADNGHWPYQIYIREARRMKGAFIMTENEITCKKPVPHPVGMGSYNMDSHNEQRYITAEGFVQNEGDIEVPLKQPYQIDMGSIMPLKSECTNLLVPVAVSSSHIAYGSIRMEPVFMILGESAATIACLAIEKGVGMYDLPYKDIKAKLTEDKQVLE